MRNGDYTKNLLRIFNSFDDFSLKRRIFLSIIIQLLNARDEKYHRNLVSELGSPDVVDQNKILRIRRLRDVSDDEYYSSIDSAGAEATAAFKKARFAAAVELFLIAEDSVGLNEALYELAYAVDEVHELEDALSLRMESKQIDIARKR